MNILLLGANGQLGWQLRRALAPLGHLTAWDRSDDGGDLDRPERMVKAVRALRPDVLVNAAAYTAVDKAEHDADSALRINATAPQAMARLRTAFNGRSDSLSASSPTPTASAGSAFASAPATA